MDQAEIQQQANLVRSDSMKRRDRLLNARAHAPTVAYSVDEERQRAKNEAMEAQAAVLTQFMDASGCLDPEQARQFLQDTKFDLATCTTAPALEAYEVWRSGAAVRDEAVTTLLEMGFGADESVAMLEQCKGDVQIAIEMLTVDTADNSGAAGDASPHTLILRDVSGAEVVGTLQCPAGLTQIKDPQTNALKPLLLRKPFFLFTSCALSGFVAGQTTYLVMSKDDFFGTGSGKLCGVKKAIHKGAFGDDCEVTIISPGGKNDHSLCGEWMMIWKLPADLNGIEGYSTVLMVLWWCEYVLCTQLQDSAIWDCCRVTD